MRMRRLTRVCTCVCVCACAHAGAVAKEAEPLEELAGDYCARAFYSKNWQLRDAALNFLTNQVGHMRTQTCMCACACVCVFM